MFKLKVKFKPSLIRRNQFCVVTEKEEKCCRKRKKWLLSLVAPSSVLETGGETLATFLGVLRFGGRDKMMMRVILVQEEEGVGEGSKHVLGKILNKWCSCFWLIFFIHHYSKLSCRIITSQKLLQHLFVIHILLLLLFLLLLTLLEQPCFSPNILLLVS